MTDYARADKFKELRESRHLRQDDAADEIGISDKTLRKYEAGGSIRWSNAKKAAAFYGVEPEELVIREIYDPKAQLDRIERKVDEILKRLDDPPQPATGDGPQIPGPPPLRSDPEPTPEDPAEEQNQREAS